MVSSKQGLNSCIQHVGVFFDILNTTIQRADVLSDHYAVENEIRDNSTFENRFISSFNIITSAFPTI